MVAVVGGLGKPTLTAPAWEKWATKAERPPPAAHLVAGWASQANRWRIGINRGRA